MTASVWEVDSLPDRFLHHRIDGLRIFAIRRTDLEALLRKADCASLRDGIESAQTAGSRGNHSVAGQLKPVVMRDALDRLKGALGIDDSSIGIEKIDVPAHFYTADHARYGSLDSCRLNQWCCFAQIFLEHHGPELEHLNCVDATNERGALQVLAQRRSERFNGVGERQVRMSLELVPEIVCDRFMKCLA